MADLSRGTIVEVTSENERKVNSNENNGGKNLEADDNVENFADQLADDNKQDLKCEVTTSSLRRESVKSGKQHTYEQLHGSSTRELTKGHHDQTQLKRSILERQPNQKEPDDKEYTNVTLKSLSEKREDSTHDTIADNTNTAEDSSTDPRSNGNDGNLATEENSEMYGDGFIINQPQPSIFLSPNAVMSPFGANMAALKFKAPLIRRKSLNPRVMTPPGLEVLANQSILAVRQQMETDIKGGCGVGNTYKIWDINDEQIFFATEDSSCICRWVCGPARKFSLDVFSPNDDQVLSFHRSSCRCDCCCCLDCCLCLQKLYIVDCLGRTLGAVKQKFSIFNAKFDIVDHDDKVLFKVLGPCCPCRCSTEIYFQILNKTGERQLGCVQKKWGGDRTDSINVDHEYFEITFPAGLEAVDKALIMGAAFLVEFMYMEMS